MTGGDEEEPWLSYGIVEAGDYVILRLEGELDSVTGDVGVAAFEQAAELVEDRLVIDMRGVTFISSGGMRIVDLARDMVRRGVSVSIQPSPIVYRFLGVAGFVDVFDVDW